MHTLGFDCCASAAVSTTLVVPRVIRAIVVPVMPAVLLMSRLRVTTWVIRDVLTGVLSPLIRTL